MLAQCFSRWSRLITYGVVVWQALNSSIAVAGKVVIDPGHGGPTDLGLRATSTCFEKSMNLWSSQELVDILNGTSTMVAEATRLDDSYVTVDDRIRAADRFVADIFVSIHHENPAAGVPFSACTSAGIYAEATDGFTPANRYLGLVLSHDTHAHLDFWLSGQYPYLDAGAVRNIDYLPCPDCYTPELGITNQRVRAIISPFGAGCPDGLGACTQGNAISHSEAYGISDGIWTYFYNPNGNRGFKQIGSVGYYVTLEWFEWSGAVLTYTLERSDNCWGPYERVADITTESDRVYYQYVDDTVGYTRLNPRPYYYRLIRLNEISTTTAETLDLPEPTPPGTPVNLVCTWTGADYRLTWHASSGVVDGYRIIHGPDRGELTNCESAHDFIATTTDTSYTTMLSGHYRVLAYNESGSSDVSSEVVGGIPTDVVQDDRDDEVDRRLTTSLQVDPNGTGFEFTLPQLDRATIAVYDVRGRLVVTVYSGATMAGRKHVAWNREGRSGRVASGIYFARLYTDLGKPVTQRFILVR